MIYAKVAGKVTRAPAANGRQVTIGLLVRAFGDPVTVNGVASKALAGRLLRFRVGDDIELSGSLQPKVYVNEHGDASAMFDINVHEVSKPPARWAKQA